MARTGYALPVDPLNELGNPEEGFKSPAQLSFMRTLIDIIRKAFTKFVDRDTAAPYFHLYSLSGKTYRVTVDDTGALKATYVRG